MVKEMFSLTKVVLKIDKKRFEFSHDRYGYQFLNEKDAKKFRSGRNTFTVPIGNDKTATIEEYQKGFTDIYRIGHIELRNLSFDAATATIYYMKNGKEQRRNLKDPSDIEIAIEDGIYMEDDE